MEVSPQTTAMWADNMHWLQNLPHFFDREFGVLEIFSHVWEQKFSN